MSVTVSDVVQVPITFVEMQNAARLTFLKVRTIGDTFEQRSSAADRFPSSMIGDAAKLAVRRWLTDQGLTVTDWDDVRTSWRSSRKPYDLKVDDASIEVASSVLFDRDLDPKPDLNWVIENEHIIQPVRKTQKDYIVQVHFIAPDDLNAYITGWTTWDDLCVEENMTVRRVAGRLCDFYMLPFDSPSAYAPIDIVSELT